MKSFIYSIFTGVLFFCSLAMADSYFQQSVHYKIQVTLDTEKKTYHGQERLIYKNNSPDTLTYIWMHLYPNAFKTNDTPFARQMASFGKRSYHFSKPKTRGYLNLTSVQEKGRPLKWHLKQDAIDEAKIQLAEPLLPGDSLVLELSFEGKFPKVFSRMGYFDGNYFAATQWYPKVVVYDQRGWHPDSYLEMGEFYGEYGTFDVEITLPRQFVIDATGMLQDNPQEEAFMKQLADTTQYLIKLPKKERKRFVKKWLKTKKEALDVQDTKTVRFVAENVHNFAWFAGPAYMLLRKTHNHGVLTNVLVTPQNAYAWRHVPEYVEKTVAFYGKHVGRYQYPKASVVDGAMKAGGGMEYPMITIVSFPGMKWMRALEIVVMHEVGHNWFMGMLGSDERASTFLDEGMNSFLEYKYMEHYYGRYNVTDFSKLFKGWHLLNDVGEWDLVHMTYGTKLNLRADQPMNLRAEEYSRSNYSSINYHKGIALLLALEWYLTPDVFWRGMHLYFDRWNGKHPQITDFFETMSEVSGTDLDWFVEDWYNSTKFCDFVVSSAKTIKKGQSYETKVFIRNKGTMKDMPAPVRLITESGDTLHKRWQADPNKPVLFEHAAPAKQIKVNPEYRIFETNYLNNRTGLPEVEVNFFPQIPRFEVYQMTVLPYYYYENYVDKHRLGVLFWTGNPIIMQWFMTGHVFYAIHSRKTGYEFSLTNRFHFPFVNFTDIRAQIMDKDGMKRGTVKVHNYFQSRDRDDFYYKLDFILNAVDLYNQRYYEPDYVEQEKYETTALEMTYYKKSMLTRFKFWLKAEKALPVFNSAIDYSKIELDARARLYFSRSGFIRLRAYSGGLLSGTAPLQEYIFVAGDIDPKHEQFLWQRRGIMAPNHYYSLDRGMRMYGYNQQQNPFFHGKIGASFSVETKFVKFLPNIYGSVAVLGDKISELNKDRLFAESGIKITMGPAKIILPLYVSDPAPGEKHLQLRAMVQITQMLQLGF